MKTRHNFAFMITSVILLLSFPAFAGTAYAQESQAQMAKSAVSSTLKTQVKQVKAVQHSQYATPAPFMYQPYYGKTQMSSRMVSFFDHDRPWYVTDDYFVRYDGYRATGAASVYNCQTGVDCYDGHDGYDYNMYYEPVLSAAAGKVSYAGWYSTDHSAAFGLHARIDHGNTLMTVYGHLSMLNVATNDKVGAQWQIGTSGTTGASTGPHLHFSTYYLPNWNATDPNGWHGSGADPNVVPDNTLWLSRTGSSEAVPNLSSTGLASYPGATVIDDGGKGWSSTGNWNNATGSTDVNGDLHWTSTTDGSANASATWQPTLRDGYYEVGAFVDDNNATSSWATYTIYSADPNHPGNQLKHTLEVDESRIGTSSWNHAQWVGLGTYYFSANQPGQVTLTNATGEVNTQIAADGMEFVPVTLSHAPGPQKFGFSLAHDGTPASLVPKSPTQISLTIKNDSNFSWTSKGSQTTKLIYRWLNAQKQPIGQPTSLTLPHTVPAGATIQMNVPVQVPNLEGNYALQWDMQSGKTVFSQKGVKIYQDPVTLAYFIEKFSTGSFNGGSLFPGQSTSFDLTVQNAGAQTWPATGDKQVMLGYRWVDSNGQDVPSPGATGVTLVPLNADLKVGESATLPVTITAPVLAGNYRLVFDMQQQGSWFALKGASPKTTPVSTTPDLSRNYYFAEGYTGTGTTEFLALTNPAAAPAAITVTYFYQRAGLAPRVRTYQMAAQSQQVLDVKREAGANQAVALQVRGNQPFVAQRTMYMQNGHFTAGSTSLGSSALSTRWYFAEGNTTTNWNTLLAVLNPSNQPAKVQVQYLLNGQNSRAGNGYSRTYTIAAHSRGTLVLNQDRLGAHFGMVVQASKPVLVERPEYLMAGAQRGGSSVTGMQAPRQSWYFAGGQTGNGFNEQLALANPSNHAANVQISYLTSVGQQINQQVQVGAMSRQEINVNAMLANSAHSTVISSDQPIVVERLDAFSTSIAGQTISGSTLTRAAESPRASWFLAQGNATSGHFDQLALANPANHPVEVRIVYYRNNAGPLVKLYTLNALSRSTLSLANEVGGQVVGVAVYGASPVLVEQTGFFTNAQGGGEYASPASGN